MSAVIHHTAVVDPKAQIADGVVIGPMCVVGPEVTLKEGVELISSVTVMGETVIGEGTKVFPYAVLGGFSQHIGYLDAKSKLFIGKNNVIREHVTMHVGTPCAAHKTVVGDNGLFMVGVHIAHDCVVGNNVVMTNNASIAGHVVIEDNVVMGGFSGAHQFTRIGKGAMIGGLSGVGTDVIPYGLVAGNRATLKGLNMVGMKRRGFSDSDIRKLHRAYEDLFINNDIVFSERIERVAEAYKGFKPVEEIIAFIKKDAKRNLCHPSTNDK